MTTEAKSAFGTTLKKGATAIAELTNIGGPSLSADTLDVTSLDSADGYREFIQGVRDGGEISIEGNFIPGNAGQVALVTDLNDGSLDAYTITFPAAMATTWTFNAIVTAFECSAPFDDKASFTATLKVSGKPVLGVTVSADISALVYTDSVGVKTSIPLFVATIYDYSVTIATTSSWIKVTVTQATAELITATCLGVVHTLTSGAISEQITVGAAVTTTDLIILVRDAGKVAKTYEVHVVRP